jgi:hypothetical protein
MIHVTNETLRPCFAGFILAPAAPLRIPEGTEYCQLNTISLTNAGIRSLKITCDQSPSIARCKCNKIPKGHN